MVLVHEPFVPTPDSEEWSDPRRRYERDTSYYSHMMTYTDKIVGEIQDKLKEKGIHKNTLLIFTADNGTHTSVISYTKDRRVRGAKGNTISDGVRVPLLIQWPDKIRKGRKFHGMIEFSDFYATFAELVDRQVTSDGRSFLPLIEERSFEERETVRVHYDPRWGENVNRYRNIFIQTMDYKLYQDGTFYDLKNDILEKSPLQEENMNETEKALRDSLAQLLSI
jgi:arylsulfatase A